MTCLAFPGPMMRLKAEARVLLERTHHVLPFLRLQPLSGQTLLREGWGVY